MDKRQNLLGTKVEMVVILKSFIKPNVICNAEY